MTAMNQEKRAADEATQQKSLQDDSSMLSDALQAAKQYLSLGWVLTPIPIGTKAPKIPGWNTPKVWLDSHSQAEQAFSTPMNMGVILQPSGLCSFDVDDRESTKKVFSEFGFDYAALLLNAPRIRGAEMNRDKALFRLPTTGRLEYHKLSWSSGTIFELRTGLIQDVLPPSLHPEGHAYTWLREPFSGVPELPADLLQLWIHFRALEPQLKALDPMAKPVSQPKAKERTGEHSDIIGKYNEKNTVQEILETNGYKPMGRRFLAPSSKTGVPGVTIFPDGKCVSKHASDPLCDEHSHDAFDVFRILKHNGDFSQAVKDAAETLGIAFTTEKKKEYAKLNETDSEKKIKGLARMTALAYERARLQASDELGIRASMLDKLVKAEQMLDATKDDSFFPVVQSWEEPVDGADLLDEMLGIFQRFVIADPETLLSATLWAGLTWLADYATVLPLLVISAPEKGCGKTILLGVIGKLSRKPLSSSNITPAALFRSVEAWQPTLLIDEADSFCKDNEDLRGILDSGHIRAHAYCIRIEEENGKRKPVRFSTWAPKALAGIRLNEKQGGLGDTIISRSIIIPMRRKVAGELTENLRHASDEVFEPVRQKLCRWASDNGVEFGKHRPLMGFLQNRDADNWESLLSIADLAGGEWPNRVRKAVFRLVCGQEKAPSMNEELLSDIQEIFSEKKVSKISTADLLRALCSDEEKPWATFNRGFPFRPVQLSKRLHGFGISPKTIRINDETFKGYVTEEFQDSFKRYLHAGGGGVN